MKKRLLTIVPFLLGLFLCGYPLISSLVERQHQQNAVATYQGMINKESLETLKESTERAKRYNNLLWQVNDAIVGDIGNRELSDEAYQELLNLSENGIMGTLQIPKINVNLPIYHGTDEEVLKNGIGHLQGSSLPVGGKSTHCILSAHRGLPSAKLFTDLNLVEEGDVFYLHVLGKTLAYEVDQILTVLPEQTESLGITDGDDYVTLVTCTPYAVNTHRLLVRGHRVPMKAAKAVQKTEKKVTGITNPTLPMLALCVVIGIVIAVILVAGINSVQNKKRRRK